LLNISGTMLPSGGKNLQLITINTTIANSILPS
jgi:hypothetical protein